MTKICMSEVFYPSVFMTVNLSCCTGD